MSFRNDYEEQVRAWGFDRVFTWSDSPHRIVKADALTCGCSNTHYPPHSHAALTTHLIVEGELTLWYPREESSQKQTYGVGSRIDVEAGRVHEVIFGKAGCTMVIGE